jgi:hypothetical protein
MSKFVILKYDSEHYTTDLDTLKDLKKLTIDQVLKISFNDNFMELGLVNCTRYLIKHGYKFPPKYLRICCLHGYTLCLKALIQNSYWSDSSDPSGSPMHCAIKKDNLNCLKILSHTETMFTCYMLAYACEHNAINCLQYMLETSASEIDTRVLEQCVISSNWDCLKMCFSKMTDKQIQEECTRKFWQIVDKNITSVPYGAIEDMCTNSNQLARNTCRSNNYQYLSKNPEWINMFTRIGSLFENFDNFEGFYELKSLCPI